MIALVTGGSRGIGHAIAISLAKAGHTVIAAARSIEGAEALASLQAGGAVIGVNLDIASAVKLSAFSGQLSACVASYRVQPSPEAQRANRINRSDPFTNPG